jgi:hypothetical protein
MMMSTLYETNTLSWTFIVLADNNPRIDISLHSGTLFWFQANMSLLLLLSTEYLAEDLLIPIL